MWGYTMMLLINLFLLCDSKRFFFTSTRRERGESVLTEPKEE